MRCFTDEYTARVKITEIEIIIKVFMQYIVFISYLCGDVRFKFNSSVSFTPKGCKDFIIFTCLP